MDMMCTYMGKMINLEAPQPKDICIEDIAHALSYMCRYTGHTSKFYSVAEHCVLLSEAVNMPGTPLARLLHDAAEAYLGDIISPLKQFLPTYQILEERMNRIIAKKYQVDFDPVKPGDTTMMVIEANVLMPMGFFQGFDAEQALPYLDPEIKIEGWSPEVAEKRFLARAGFLGIATLKSHGGIRWQMK